MKIAIISDGLAGFMLAHVLVKKGHSVTLIDTDNQPQTDGRFRDLGLSFLPNTPLVRHGLTLLKECFDIDFEMSAAETAPLTIDDGEIKPFIGFGDSHSPAIQPLSTFNITSILQINRTEQDLVHLAQTSDTFKILPFSEISSLQFNQSRLEAVTVNGQNNVSADRFIFLNNPADLLHVLPPELIGAKTRSRIAKSASWARLTLRMIHKAPAPMINELLFLLPKQVDQIPCVGQFQQQASTQTSLWQTYVPAELAEDAAFVADNLKNMRKLVTKAFSTLEMANETVSVDVLAMSDLEWAFENKDLGQLGENFVFSPRLANSSDGLAQSVECLSRAFDGIASSEAQSDVTPSEPALLSPL